MSEAMRVALSGILQWITHYHKPLTRAIVSIIGLGLISMAAFTIALSLGLFVAGISVFLAYGYVTEVYDKSAQ